MVAKPMSEVERAAFGEKMKAARSAARAKRASAEFQAPPAVTEVRKVPPAPVKAKKPKKLPIVEVEEPTAEEINLDDWLL